MDVQDEEEAKQMQQGNVFAAMMAAIQATQTNKVAQAIQEVNKQKQALNAIDTHLKEVKQQSRKNDNGQA